MTKTIVIVGAGAVGRYLALKLQESHKIILVNRTCDLPRFQGIQVSNMVILTNHVYDYVFICTKVYSNPPLIEFFRYCDKPIILFQNGLDIEQEWFQQVYRCVVNWGAVVDSNGNIRETFQANYSYCNHEGVTEILNNVQIPCHYKKELFNEIWTKTILNAALAPLCAISRLPMDRALMRFKLLVKGILMECCLLKCEIDDGSPSTYMDLVDVYVQWLEKAGTHKPSMLIDIERKKPTENPWITGKILEYGKKYHQTGKDMLFNELMYELVDGLESSYRK